MKNLFQVQEKLANYAHKAWSGWMEYVFSKSIPYKPGEVQGEEGALIVPKWAVDRWQRQIETKYEDLPEREKDSDRAEASTMLAIVKDWENKSCE